MGGGGRRGKRRGNIDFSPIETTRTQQMEYCPRGPRAGQYRLFNDKFLRLGKVFLCLLGRTRIFGKLFYIKENYLNIIRFFSDPTFFNQTGEDSFSFEYSSEKSWK